MICKKCGKTLPEEAVFCLYCGTRQESVQRRHQRGNGQGSVYKQPNGKYRAVVSRYVMRDGQYVRLRKSRVFDTKKDAVSALASMRPDDKPAIRCTLRELHDQYIASKEYLALSRSQQEKLGIAWKRWGEFADVDIASLTVDDLQRHIDATTHSYYPARDMSVILSHLYKIAIKKEIVPTNKTDYIDLPDQPKPKLQCWTAEEIAAMWEDYKTHPFTGYILIMCYAGLRKGELSSIQLENIHVDDGFMIGGIKSEAGIDREIPLADKIRPVIKTVLGIGSHKKYLLEMNEDNFYSAYWAMVERTGIRKLPPQTCRHFYFSSMTAAGVQAGIIIKAGGHGSYSTTLKNYVSIPLEDKIKAVNSIQ